MKLPLKAFLIIFTGVSLIAPLVIYAQIITPYTIEDAQTESEIIITPRYPSVGERVSVELSSFAIDLNNSLISFYKNNVLLRKDFGVRKVGYGEINSLTEIKVIIETPDGTIIEKIENLIPGSVDILWEAESYRSPFYKGKSLYTKESALRLHAIPTMRDARGRIISSDDIDYTWKINGKVQNDVSGLGKDTVSIEEIFLGSSITIEVLAKSKNEEVFATQRETIRTQRPQILFYEDDPLYGINWSQSLKNTSTSDEISLWASPFYFSTKNHQNLLYTWTANNQLLSENTNRITLRSNSNLQGVVRLVLNIDNIQSFFEKSQENITLQFN